jgi:hypothetical protein
LDTFIKENSVLAFKNEFSRIQNSINKQRTRFSDYHYFLPPVSLPTTSFNFSFSSIQQQQQQPFPVAHIVNPRRPSANIFNLSPPQSPSTVQSISNTTSLIYLDSKDIARYLTLADFYLFKSIQPYDILYSKKKKARVDYDFIDIMTKRANMVKLIA